MSNSTPASTRWTALALLLIIVAATVGLISVIDLTPKVGSDFFFTTDDPQLRSSSRIADMFPSQPQILVRAAHTPAPDTTIAGGVIDGDSIEEEAESTAWMTAEYVDRVRELSNRLMAVEGVEDVISLTKGPSRPSAVVDAPLWRRLLLTPGVAASQLVLQVDDSDPSTLVPAIQAVLDELEEPGFRLDMSGVPVVVELVRRQLQRDLRRFSVAALLVFGLAVAVVFRSLWVVMGTLAACLAACATTLALLQATDVTIGPLTANLATIVFVLTLSHIVFLTASWRRGGSGVAEGVSRVGGAIRETLPASFWCMTTTLLGFLSLRFADARPMRELGTAGAIGTVTALAVAFLIYPVFLRAAAAVADRPEQPGSQGLGGVSDIWLGQGTSRRAVLGLALLTLVAALGLLRVQTDPSLLSYFQAGSELRAGLEAVDEAGGSSPLELIVKLPEGGPVDTLPAMKRLEAFQEQLESDAAVGSALGLPVVVAQARQAPLMGFAPLPRVIDILFTSLGSNVGPSFVTEDRHHARFFLRMREAYLLEQRDVDRRRVVQRLVTAAQEQDLEVELVGGLYDLQGRLSELVASSLVTGLTALLLLFVVVAALVARHWRPALAMVASLVAVAVITLGSLGHLGLPLDVIASPAANIAIALGVDSMIHLVAGWRRSRQSGLVNIAAWTAARREMLLPILGAALILAAGFGIFSLSSFPPTRNFGIAVVIGTLAAAAMTLVVLPFLASHSSTSGGRSGSGSRAEPSTSSPPIP